MVEECTSVIDENKIYNETLNPIRSNDSLSDCISCTLYVVLFSVFLTTSVIIGGVSVYFHWYSKKEDSMLESSQKKKIILVNSTFILALKQNFNRCVNENS